MVTMVERPRGAATSAWAEYASDSDGESFDAFCADFLIHTVDEWDGDPVVLEEWQADVFGEALAVTEEGRWHWRTVVLCLPRGNGKTTMMAAYALYRLMTDGGDPQILLAASSNEQADLAFEMVEAFIRSSPALGARLTVRSHDGEILRNDKRGKIKRVAANDRGLHGYNASLVVCDELHVWGTPTLRKAWSSIKSGMRKRPSAQAVVITTAGEAHERATGILGSMIDGNEKQGEVEARPGLRISRDHSSRTLIYNWTAPTMDPHDVAAMKLANPASWITEETLAEVANDPSMRVDEILRLNGGVWASSDRTWITVDSWRGARVDEQLRDGEMVCLGFDGSRIYDSTALVACRVSDGMLAPLRIWTRPERVSEWEVPAGEVDAAVADAISRFKVLRLYADPPYWQSEIDSWALAYGSPPVVRFETSKPRMSAAAERFRTDLIAGDLVHNGDLTLEAHVLAAQMRVNRFGYVLEKPLSADNRSRLKIDCAVAAVCAYEARCDAVAKGEDAVRVRSRRLVSFS